MYQLVFTTVVLSIDRTLMIFLTSTTLSIFPYISTSYFGGLLYAEQRQKYHCFCMYHTTDVFPHLCPVTELCHSVALHKKKKIKNVFNFLIVLSHGFILDALVAVINFLHFITSELYQLLLVSLLLFIINCFFISNLCFHFNAELEKAFRLFSWL